MVHPTFEKRPQFDKFWIVSSCHRPIDLNRRFMKNSINIQDVERIKGDNMQILRDVYKDGAWSAPDMILKLADEEQNNDENQEKKSFQTPNRLGLPDVLFSFSGWSPKLLII